MIINKEKLQKILKLVALDSSGITQDKMTKELNQLIQWVEKIKEVDVTDISTFTTMSTACDRFSEGPPAAPMTVQDALMNAPKHDGAYFCVPPTTVPSTDT